MAKEPYADDIARLSTAKRTHFTHFQVPKLPWHTDDHKFGESSDGGGEEDRPNLAATLEPPGVTEDYNESTRAARRGVASSPLSLVDIGRCYWCKEPAVYGYKGKLYCPDCWLGLREDGEDPFRGRA